eukprot:1923519-Prymnesium_polylepis.1
MLSSATYRLSWAVIVPVAAAVITPDSAAETHYQLSSAAMCSVLVVPFVNDAIDRLGNAAGIMQVISGISVASSVLFFIAFRLKSAVVLWCAALTAATCGHASILGVAAALSTSLIAAAPERAGAYQAMNLLGYTTACSLCLFAASQFPIATQSAGEMEIDLTAILIHMFLALFGLVMLLTIIRSPGANSSLFSLHVNRRSPGATMPCSLCAVIASVLRGFGQVLLSSQYSGVLLSSLAAGAFFGIQNS